MTLVTLLITPLITTWRPRGLSKWVISRVVSTLNGVTLMITLLITDLLSPLGLQVPVNLRKSLEQKLLKLVRQGGRPPVRYSLMTG